MFKTKSILALLVALTLCVLSAACGSQTGGNPPAAGAPQTKAPAAENPITLRIAHVVAKDSHFDYAAKLFKESVEAQTNGKIKVEIYPNGQLGQEREVLENLQSGVIEMTITGHDPLAMFSPMVSALSMPYVFENEAHAFRVIDSNFGAQIKKEVLTKNLRIIEFGANGYRVLTTTSTPVNTPADMRGLKVRSPQAPVNLAITKALGGVPMATPFGETYSALQQKVIDGQENALPQIFDSKYAEVQKYLCITNHLYGFTTMIISEPIFAKLTPEQQEIITKAGREAMIKQRAYSVDLSNNVLVGSLEKAGMTVIRPNLALFKEATKDVYKEFMKDFGGQQVYDQLTSIK